MREGLLLGLDLGGTHVKAAVGPASANASEGERVLWDAKFPTNAASGRAAVLEAIRGAATAARAEIERRGETLLAIGLGSPGVIDPTTGIALYDTANLPEWQGVNLKSLLEEPFEVPVRIGNDASVAALAEARWGAARGCQQMVMATVGTGIGGGAVANGTLVTGAWGAGMELGHVPYEEGGRPCGCGQRGCVEAYAGGRGLRAAWIEALDEQGGATAAQLAELELPEMLRRAEQGDTLALELLRVGAHALGSGLLAALYLLNPEVVVMGGGVVDGFERYVEWVENALRERALPKVTERLRVVRAEFGNQAGVLGAMALAASAVENLGTDNVSAENAGA
ncbi:MAG: ROK family protein [Planctomycetota bacterium]